MVLAGNVDGGDDLDLIVTTMNGNVFCFSTPSPHHPLKVLRFALYSTGRILIVLMNLRVFVCISSGSRGLC